MTHVRLRYPIGAVPDAGPRYGVPCSISPARSTFLRGTDVLYGEQVDAYGAYMVHLSESSCRDMVRSRLARLDRVSERIIEHAARKADKHRATYPRAYLPNVVSPGQVTLESWRHRDDWQHGVLVGDLRRERNELDNAATAWLLANDPDLPVVESGPRKGKPIAPRTLDVTVRHHLQVIPDVVAYRGPDRYKRPPAARYGVNPTRLPGESVEDFKVRLNRETKARRCWIATTSEIIGMVSLHKTTIVGHRQMFGCTNTKRGPWMRSVAEHRWFGTSDPIGAAKLARKAVRAEHAAAVTTSAYGPLPSWWEMADRSVPRWWTKADNAMTDQARTIEDVILTSVRDVPVQLCGQQVTVTERPYRVITEHGTYSPASFARRAVLAGVVID